MEQLTLNMIPNGYTPTAHISQYDDGRHIRFNLQNINLAGNETVTLKIRKTNGELVTKTIENHTSYVEYVSEKADCDYSGTANCEIVISKDNTVLGSKNFLMKVEADAYDGAGVVTETASGRIATFETNMVDVLQSVKCEINAKQDLHGYDHPWPAGGGKNVLPPYPNADTTVSDVHIVVNNGHFTASGTTSGSLNYVYNANKIRLKAGTYTLSFSGSMSSDCRFYARNYTDSQSLGQIYNGSNSMTFTFTEEKEFGIYLNVANAGITVNIDVYLQLEIGTSATAYEPYENVCPIIGIDELNIQRTGNNINSGLSEVTIPSSSSSISPAITRVYLEAGQTYTFSCYQDNDMSSNTRNTMRLNKVGDMSITYYENTLPNYHLNKGLHTFTVTIQESGEYDLIFWGHSLSDITLYKEFQIEFGSTATPYHSYSGKLIKFEFDDTVYLAEVSCLNGVWKLKLLGKEVDLGTLNYTMYSVAQGNLFRSDEFDIKRVTSTTEVPDIISSAFVAVASANRTNYTISMVNNTARIDIIDDDYSDAVTFKSAMSGVKLVYPLATPTEITLDETEQFEALIGVNNVWHDGNGDTEVKYLFDA